MVLASGAAKRLKGVAEALRRRADECFPPMEGSYPPPEGTVLLDKLTDELLVVASDVVSASAAAYRASIKDLVGVPAFSGKAQLRLLAWLVADARGAVELLGKAEAETVGKRLERQAQKVRAELDAARAAAATDRAHAKAAGGDDGLLAVINATEQAATNHARDEVYVGFHELESLLPQAEPEPEPEPAPAPVPAPAPPGPPSAANNVEDNVFTLCEALEAKGVRCPLELLHYEEESAACPPDLEALIGSEAVQEIRDRVCSSSIRFTSGKDWWEFGLPRYARMLFQDRARIKQHHAEDMDSEAERCAEETERARAEIDELNEEIDELRDQLERAKGREEALHAVIHRCRWG